MPQRPPDYNKAAGSERANYAPPSDGPFTCRTCVHFGHEGQGKKSELLDTERGPCDHPDVILDAHGHFKGLLLRADGKALVQAGGCCRYQK